MTQERYLQICALMGHLLPHVIRTCSPSSDPGDVVKRAWRLAEEAAYLIDTKARLVERATDPTLS